MTFRYLTELKENYELSEADRRAAEYLESAELQGGPLSETAVRWTGNLLLRQNRPGSNAEVYERLNEYGREHLSDLTKIITDLDVAMEPTDTLPLSQRLRMALFLSGMDDTEIARFYPPPKNSYARTPSNERRIFKTRLNAVRSRGRAQMKAIDDVRNQALKRIIPELQSDDTSANTEAVREIKVYPAVTIIQEIEASFKGRFLRAEDRGLLYKYFLDEQNELTVPEARAIARSLSVLREVLQTKISQEKDIEDHPKLQASRLLLEVMLGDGYHRPKSRAVYVEDTEKNYFLTNTKKLQIISEYPARLDLALSWLLEKKEEADDTTDREKAAS